MQFISIPFFLLLFLHSLEQNIFSLPLLAKPLGLLQIGHLFILPQDDISMDKMIRKIQKKVKKDNGSEQKDLKKLLKADVKMDKKMDKLKKMKGKC